MRILLITSRFPLPPWRGNQVRTLEWLEALGGHDRILVTPAPADPGLVAELEARSGARVVAFRSTPAAAARGLLGALATGRPLQEGIYNVAGARAALQRALAGGRPDVVAVQMLRCWWAMETLGNSCPEVPVVFDAIDAMGLHFGRAARLRPWPVAAAFRAEARRCRTLERRLTATAAVTVAVARRDLEALEPPGGRGLVVPVGAPERKATDLASADSVLLSGNLGYRPTVEGALWFASEVWPELRRRAPGARWVLAGARPARAIRRLSALPGVEVHADVPDLAPYLASARVAIAPMASGSGVPMKVLEAWASGVPVVARRWAAEGLSEAAGEALVADDDPAVWVAALLRLLEDPGEARRLGRKGRKAWAAAYHPRAVAAGIRNAVSAAVGQDGS